MKTQIYISLIVILIVVSLILLLLYYTQEFSEEFSFNSVLTKENVEYKFSGDYISEINTDLGKLTLKNDGIFTQVYSFPEIVGCIDFKENSKSISNRMVRVYLDYLGDYSYPLNKRNPLEVPTGREASFKIRGIYAPNSNQISLVELEKSVNSITLYKVSTKEENPFDSNYNYYYGDYYNLGDCNTLALKYNPLKVISFLPS